MLFVYILAGLIVGLLIVAATLPSKYNVEKNIIINKPVVAVKDKIGNLENYSKWNPWQQMDPAATKRITGPPHAPGHKYEWQGKKIGTGNLTLTDIDANHIHFDLEFLKPWKSKAKDNWLFEEWGNGGTKVTWQNSGNLPYPVARLMGPTINKNLHHQFDNGLKNLKKMCEEC